MNSVLNKTRLAENRYRDKLKKDKKNLNKLKERIKNKKKLEIVKKYIKSTIIKYKNQK